MGRDLRVEEVAAGPHFNPSTSSKPTVTQGVCNPFVVPFTPVRVRPTIGRLVIRRPPPVSDFQTISPYVIERRPRVFGTRRSRSVVQPALPRDCLRARSLVHHDRGRGRSEHHLKKMVFSCDSHERRIRLARRPLQARVLATVAVIDQVHADLRPLNVESASPATLFKHAFLLLWPSLIRSMLICGFFPLLCRGPTDPVHYGVPANFN